MEQEKIFTVAFEGAHRVGKGVQIDLLSKKLDDLQIPNIVLRGDGSRTGQGKEIGDPTSFWWQNIWNDLHDKDKPKELWNTAAFRLAEELLVWRDRALPRYVRELDSEYGIILVDRSLLSRTMIPREITPNTKEIDLYPEKDRFFKGHPVSRPIDVNDVCPDLIFELIAPKDVLLSRIDPNDSKGDFRRRLLEERYDWYLSSAEYLPQEIQDKIVRIDSTQEISEVQDEILDAVFNKLN